MQKNKARIAAIAVLLTATVALAALELFFPAFLAANRRLRAASSQEAGTINIYVAGESTAVGVPYDSELSFSRILAWMYGGRLGPDRINIINLAQQGSGLEAQYWALLKELSLRPPRKGLLLVYAGINETGVEEDTGAVARWRLAQGSVLLSKLLFLAEGEELEPVFGPRSTPAKFEYRLRRLVSLAASHGLRTVISTLSGNFSGLPPYRSGEVPAGPVYAAALRSEAAGRWKEAADLYAGLLVVSHGQPELHYRLGVCLAKRGRAREAAAHFLRVADYGQQKRPTSIQNDTIRRVAASQGARLVETAELFERASPGGLVGYNLFLDAHHPNLAGYLLLAGSFSAGVSELTGIKPRRSAPTEREMLAAFPFSDDELFEVHASRVKWFCANSTMSTAPEQLIRKAEEHAAAAEALAGRLGKSRGLELKVCFLKLLISAARRDTGGVRFWLERGDFLGRNSGFIKAGNADYDSWVRGMLVYSGLPEALYLDLPAGSGAPPG
ncbi:MAG: hypothetical protein A2285_01275 [Elusimicrobia bacterium RIFOXYA12_FULL_57_11]|nr:MAG: hypothetical protein A2285_01275 [Elusimicrobia bacterium RIFOXYA12_FULL_57_11]